ncbi:MAG: threonine aldolase family protein [Actinomycetota bacterium]
MSVVPLAPPERFFASDNNAGVHPAVMEALQAANRGHAVAYWDDPWTAHLETMFDELFGRRTRTLLVWNGTGANVLALSTVLRPAGAVVCSDVAHINVDETGAPEKFLGAKLIDLPSSDGRITPDQVRATAADLGVVHHVQPCVLSITQSTEWGTLYAPDQIGALCEAAHGSGMKVHLDGARIANATVALGGGIETLRSFTVDAGVDMVSFGGTKNGMMYGEAVISLDPDLAPAAAYVRKQLTQLPSKVRYIAAQFEALLTDELWLRNAGHANAMAERLHAAVSPLVSVAPPVVTSLFPVLPRSVAEVLRAWSFFYDWDARRQQVRWMTAWDTTDADIDVFVAGLQHALAIAC